MHLLSEQLNKILLGYDATAIPSAAPSGHTADRPARIEQALLSLKQGNKQNKH